MSNFNTKKSAQLGMPFGTANAKLRKSIMFHLMKISNVDICFQCGEKIQNIDELSIEHKTPYLDSEDPKALFFDINNIAFSHLTCNTKAARQTKTRKHPSVSAYMNGCRCNECKEIERNRRAAQRSRGINT